MSWKTNEQWRLGLIVVVMGLIAILSSLLSCTTLPSATTGWCQRDSLQKVRRTDPQENINQALEHNAGYLCACKGVCPDGD